MTRSHHVKKSRKQHKADNGDVIPKGASYYWWKFNFSGVVHKSITTPLPSQLTQSGFLSQVYALTEGAPWSEPDALEDERDSFIEEIEGIKDEVEDSLQNMPEHLQETSSSGELLTERIEMLEQWKDELDCIDFSDIPDEDDFVKSPDQQSYEEALEEWGNDKISELEGVEYQGS